VRSELLKDITRVVVKLGTGVLTDSRKQPDLAQLEQLVTQVAEQRKAGREIVLVTSGAVGAGMGALGHAKRPNDLAELQACAAVGQSRLMATYEKLFGAFGLSVAQLLLTPITVHAAAPPDQTKPAASPTAPAPAVYYDETWCRVGWWVAGESRLLALWIREDESELLLRLQHGTVESEVLSPNLSVVTSAVRSFFEGAYLSLEKRNSPNNDACLSG
jgi:hypothetical protein